MKGCAEDMKKMLNQTQIREVLDKLQILYPDAHCELNFQTPYELLISTILSAQSTDKRVNIVTSELFKKHNTPQTMLQLTQEELQEEIRTIGFFRNKSKNILNTSRIIMESYDGEVPESREELMTLPGVGRKTANVVMSNAFGMQAIAVDTHVFRVSNRIGIADSKNVEDTEKDLMANIPENEWTQTHHLLIFHGRQTCKARSPKCEICTIKDVCFYYSKTFQGKDEK